MATYIKTEDSLNFLINGEMYMISKDDDRYDELSEALENGENDEVIKNIYYKQFVKDAKDLLSSLGQKKRDQ